MNVQKTIGLILLAVILGACQLLPSANVETIVKEPGMRYWKLSPNGTGLVYGGSKESENFLIDINGHKEQQIDCSLQWISEETLMCSRYNQITLLDRDTFVEIGSLERIDKKTLSEPELNNLLTSAKKILRTERDVIYLLNSNGSNYVITGIEDLDETLQGYNYVLFPAHTYCPQDALDEKSLSPNGEYYYTVIRQIQSILTIAKVADDEKVATFTTGEAEFIECGGWAGDNSGVFFRVHGVGFNSAAVPAEIKKLKVPAQ